MWPKQQQQQQKPNKQKTKWDKKQAAGNSLAVQWLGLCASTAGDMGLIPGQGTKILQSVWHGREEGRKEGREEGRKEGKKEGRKEGRKEGDVT